MTGPRRPARGYTLIEMLTVFAIIAVLATVGIVHHQHSLAAAARQSRFQLLAGLDVRAQQIAEATTDRAYPPDLATPADCTATADCTAAGLTAADPDVTFTAATSTAATQVSIDLRDPGPDPRDRTLVLAVATGRGECVLAALNLRTPPRYATDADDIDCNASTAALADITGTYTAPNSR